jgi:hypothetical protein
LSRIIDVVKSTTVDLMPSSLRADIGSIDEDTRTAQIIFSTGAGVMRYDWAKGVRYIEKLSMDPKHVRLGRINTVGNLLDSHSAWSVGDVLGAIEPGSARMANGMGLASIRFSRRASVDEIWQDVVGKILRSFSVGYNVYRYIEDTGKEGQIATRTAVDWEPYEVSLVPMPADIGATVRSGDKALTHPCVILTRSDDEDADAISTFRRLALQECASLGRYVR